VLPARMGCLVNPTELQRRRLPSPFTHPRWPQVRAVLVALHVTAVLTVACPAPVKSSDAQNWKRATVRAELVAWTKRLRAVGLAVSEQELATLGQTVSTPWSQTRTTILAPALLWLKSIGATQGWYMFTAPDRAPQRFTFALTTALTAAVTPGRASDVEHPVFDFGRAVHDDALIDVDFLSEHRVRRAFFQAAWSERPVFRELCVWLAREASARRPDVTGAVCRLVEQPVIVPATADHPPPRPQKTIRTLRVDRDGKARP